MWVRQATLMLEDAQERQAAAEVSQVALVVDTYNSAQRPQSLMEMHQQKTSGKPKKKKEGKEGKSKEGKAAKAKEAAPPPKEKESWEGIHPWKVRVPVRSTRWHLRAGCGGCCCTSSLLSHTLPALAPCSACGCLGSC
jgi:hypothetical protein